MQPLKSGSSCQQRPWFFPVILRLPDTLKETMPAAQSRAIEKLHLMRFYNVLSKGDIIEFKAHLWSVLGFHHRPLVKGLPGQDQCPVIVTEYIGAAAEWITLVGTKVGIPTSLATHWFEWINSEVAIPTCLSRLVNRIYERCKIAP